MHCVYALYLKGIENSEIKSEERAMANFRILWFPNNQFLYRYHFKFDRFNVLLSLIYI